MFSAGPCNIGKSNNWLLCLKDIILFSKSIIQEFCYIKFLPNISSASKLSKLSELYKNSVCMIFDDGSSFWRKTHEESGQCATAHYHGTKSMFPVSLCEYFHASDA